jgi:hypothetical protein
MVTLKEALKTTNYSRKYSLIYFDTISTTIKNRVKHAKNAITDTLFTDTFHFSTVFGISTSTKEKRDTLI